MTTAAALIARARELGIELVRVEPGKLRALCTPERLPGDLRAELAMHKAEVLAELAAERQAPMPRDPCSDCGTRTWIVTAVSVDGQRFCPDCLKGGRRAPAR